MLVLVVQQYAAVRDVLVEALRMEGYRVVAGDHREALDALRRANVAKPDVVLLDVHGDARGVAQELRRVHGEGVPVVAVTTMPGRLDGSEVGAAAVLPLPFELDALFECVERFRHPN